MEQENANRLPEHPGAHGVPQGNPESVIPEGHLMDPLGAVLGEPQYRRRRGSRHRGGDALQRERGRDIRSASRRTRSNRRMILLILALVAVCAAFFAGYRSGKNAKTPISDETNATSHDIVLPSSESEALLDSGFAALNGGRPRKALLDFQKVQEKQPTLVGVDYLLADAAYQCGEKSLAVESIRKALAKGERAGEASALLALIQLEKGSEREGEEKKFVDPMVAAEDRFREAVAEHPGDPRLYCLWGELVRTRGSYRSAADLFHKGVLRADPLGNQSLLSAREYLSRVQGEPPKAPPSLSEITSMSGEQALGAAFLALQQKQMGDALLFLERARDLYPPQIFREVMRDPAFSPYRTDLQIKGFLKREPDSP